MWAFAVGLTTTQAARRLGLNRKTVNRYYRLFRKAIHAHQSRQIAALVGVIECDESYFGRGARAASQGHASAGAAPTSTLCSAFSSAAARCSRKSSLT